MPTGECICRLYLRGISSSIPDSVCNPCELVIGSSSAACLWCDEGHGSQPSGMDTERVSDCSVDLNPCRLFIGVLLDF